MEVKKTEYKYSTIKHLPSVGCGDWFLSWGFGITNKLGKLYKLDKDTFIWRGHSQGRHNQMWNKGTIVVFSYIDDNITILEHNNKGTLPIKSELLKSIKEL